MSSTADVIVVGLGAAGSAALYQLARAGISAVGIDRWDPPHAMGSSHGETRITRQAIGEGEVYVPLVLRSHEIWRELEQETGERLLETCGVLIIGAEGGAAMHHSRSGFVLNTVAAAQAHGIEHEVLSIEDTRRRFPQFALSGDELVYFEPGGGFVYPERCIAAQLTLARKLGARIVTGAQVTAISEAAGGVAVQAGGTTYHADHVILAAGAWTPSLAPTLALAPLTLRRQVLHWFAPERPRDFAVGTLPAFIWLHGKHAEDSFYGFPIPDDLGHGLVKVADENQTRATADPDELDREVRAGEAAEMHRDHLAGRIPGLTLPPVRSAACLYTCAPDADFVIGPLDGTERITVVSACSGHGFKHSAAVGEHAVRLIIEGPAAAIAAFDPRRLAGSQLT
ncbi:sarcosine oxidase [Erythromicrobium ramosum]|uniref:N-methyl-L-tryptophan oxidase n=1 Tax=Erythrobacter ramosus TaxID=35811 RepID=A0A6I4UMM7_9SPHN|nr:N-methyl-L-tryptophan oxidase [Erythrobacter ramosus]MBB3776343.1 sarcosine oxidase [Erythrobacter ramosus]MXP38575.1 N-methyl-L-tryptophan oxidase [Erythrobacter ramosus]